MNNTIHLFLDLEDTIVDNWNDFLFLPSKCEKIKKFVKKHKIHSITIFSFAIDNEIDLEIFKSHYQKDLERILDTEIDAIVTVHNMMVVLGYDTFFSIKSEGKQRIFLDYIDFVKTDNCEYILIDDMVENINMEYIDTKNKIKLINIDGWNNTN